MKENANPGHSKLSKVEAGAPPGVQTILKVDNGVGSTGIYSGGGPLTVWLYQEGTPAAVFQMSIDEGPYQRLSPGTYPGISAKDSIRFQWQVNPPQVLKVGWVILSGR